MDSQNLKIAEAAVKRMLRAFHLPGVHRIANLEKIPGTYSSIMNAIEAHKGEHDVILYIGIDKGKYRCSLRSSDLSLGDLYIRIISLMRNGMYCLEDWLVRYKRREKLRGSKSMPLYRQLELAREVLREYDKSIAKWRNIPFFARP